MKTSGDDNSGDNQRGASSPNTAAIVVRDGVVTISVSEDERLRAAEILNVSGVPHERGHAHFLIDECDAVHALAALATAGTRFVWSPCQPGDHQPAALFGFTVRSPNL